MRYYLIAGEASGDLHGSNLVKALLDADAKASVRAVGGDLMKQAGAQLFTHYKDTAVMGFSEVMAKLGTIAGKMSACKADILGWKPDVLILIDYPGFNLKMARWACKNGIRVFWYIAPKVWAWKEHRVKQLRRYVEHLFVIFPFESEYFRSKGIEPDYCGNPLLDSIANDRTLTLSREEFCKAAGLDPERPVIALLPGSRTMEISFLMPRLLEVEKLLDDTPLAHAQMVVAAAPSIDDNIYANYLRHSEISVSRGNTYPLLKHSCAAIVSSGTATLETALIGTPQVVCYGVSALSYAIASRVVKIPDISLPNIILGRRAVPELIQKECTPERIALELMSICGGDSSRRSEMLASYEELRAVLGQGKASSRIAEQIIERLKEK